MKVRVKNKFVDKETKQLRKVGEEFEVTAERFAEIQNTGKNLLTVLEDKTEAKVASKAETTTATEAETKAETSDEKKVKEVTEATAG